MSSNQTPFTPPVQEFIYQNVAGSTGAPVAPVDLGIFEMDRTVTGGQTLVQPNVTEIDLQKREAAAYERGVAVGRDAARAEAESAIAAARNCVTENLKTFEQERHRYYRRIEGDIVELALAIARKVLHREAQVDRVVLAGVVRVALEKLAGSSQVSLHVHPSAAQSWQDYIGEQTVLATVPQVIEDGSLRPDQLVLKTDHGATELGIDAQLKEIEKGFSDLVQQKQRSIRQ